MSPAPDIEGYHAYMSGRMSGLSDANLEELIDGVYDPIAKLTDELGIQCYFPHKSRTSPDRATDFEDRIWEIDYQLIANCDFMLAYMGIPSFGVGAELEMARVAEVPTVMFCEEEKKDRVSRLSIGNSVTEPLITFSSRGELEERVGEKIIEIMHESRTRKVAFEEQWSTRKAEHVLDHIRHQGTIQREAIAQRGEPNAMADNGIFTRERIREIGEELDVDDHAQDTLL